MNNIELINKFLASIKNKWLESKDSKIVLEKSQNQHESFDSPSMPTGEPIVGKTYRADGWEYKEIPWTTVDALNKILSYLEDEEYEFIALSSREMNGVMCARGQVLFSPSAMKTIRELNDNADKLAR